MHKWYHVFLVVLPTVITSCVPPTTGNSNMVWEEAVTLPPDSGLTESLGYAGMLAGMAQGQVLLAGGANFPHGFPWEGGQKAFSDNVYRLAANTGKTELQLLNKGLPSAMAYAGTCTIPEGVFFAGGENTSGKLQGTGILSFDTLTQQLLLHELPPLPAALSSMLCLYAEGRVYVLGGESATASVNSFYRLSLSDTAARWERLADMPLPLSHCAGGILKDEHGFCIILAGGRTKRPGQTTLFSRNCYRFSLAEAQWQEIAPLPRPLSAGSTVVLNENQLIVLGGDEGVVFEKVEGLILEAAKVSDSALRSQLIARKDSLQRNHPGFSRHTYLYDLSRMEWTLQQDLPFPAPVTTAVVKYNDRVFLISGEIRPGIRSPFLQRGRVIDNATSVTK